MEFRVPRSSTFAHLHGLRRQAHSHRSSLHDLASQTAARRGRDNHLLAGTLEELKAQVRNHFNPDQLQRLRYQFSSLKKINRPRQTAKSVVAPSFLLRLRQWSMLESVEKYCHLHGHLWEYRDFGVGICREWRCTQCASVDSGLQRPAPYTHLAPASLTLEGYLNLLRSLEPDDQA